MGSQMTAHFVIAIRVLNNLCLVPQSLDIVQCILPSNFEAVPEQNDWTEILVFFRRDCVNKISFAILFYNTRVK